jgi:outer membrane cobalamin receptor
MGHHALPLLLTLGATTTWAAMPEAGTPPLSPDAASATVTVTAEWAPVDISRTPNPVRVLDKEAIEATGAVTLGDLLQNILPGQIFRNGGVGTASSLHLGGSRPQDVVVILDGIRLTDATALGGANPAALVLAGIERVEIQLGPCSSQYGAEAMGGAIVLTSAQQARAGLSGDLRGALGTRGVRDAGLSVAFGWKGGWVRAASQTREEDQATDTPNPCRSVGSYLGLGQNLGEDTVLTLGYRNAYVGVPIPWATVTPTTRVYDAAREDQDRNEQITGTLRSQLAPAWLAEMTVGQVLETRMEPGGTSMTAFDSRRNQATGRIGWTPSSAWSLSLLADGSEEHAAIPDYTGGDDRGAGRHLATGLEATAEPGFGLRLVGSARHQWDRQNFVSGGGNPRQPDITSDRTTWKLGANWTLGAGFRVYASGGTAYNLPLLYAVMYNSNPSNFAAGPLDAESSNFQRVGAGWQQGPWEVRVEAARTHFDHLVAFDNDHYNYVNANNLRTQSVETAVAYRGRNWGLEGSWRNQESRDLSQPEGQQLSSAAVLRTPFNILGAKAWVVSGAFRYDLRWSWTGPHYENFGGWPSTLGASKVHFNDLALGVAWAARKDITVSLRGEHLLQPRLSVQDWVNRTTDGQNDAYQVFGFPTQPPTVTLEGRWRF